MKLISIAILVYLLFVAALFIMQRSMIYFPDTSRPEPIQSAEIVKVVTQDKQELESWYFAPKISEKPVIVFFHGNAGNYGQRFYKVQSYLEAGYGILLAEYRGYGGNTGKPSEQGFYQDARAYINWLISDKKLKARQIILYGESIGSGAAVQMATEYDVAGLILESPFSSLVDVAARQYPFVPVKYLLKDKFVNIEKIHAIKTPLLVIHGDKDEVIPIALSKKLFKAARNPKKFIEFPQARHNDLYDYGALSYIMDFLTGIDEQE